METLLIILMWILIVATILINIIFFIALVKVGLEDGLKTDDKDRMSPLFILIISPFIGTFIILFMLFYINFHREEVDTPGTDLNKMFGN